MEKKPITNNAVLKLMIGVNNATPIIVPLNNVTNLINKFQRLYSPVLSNAYP